MTRTLTILFAAFALVVLAHAPALADKRRLGVEVQTKSQSSGEIAQALSNSGKARVLVTVDTAGMSRSGLSKSLRNPNSRDAMKALVSVAVSRVIASHSLAAKSAGPGQAGITVLTTAPAFALDASSAEINALAKDPRVLSIDVDRVMRKQLAVSVPSIGMPALHAAGGNGAGYSIAVIDDGVQRNHPFIGVARLLAAREACFLPTRNCPNGSNRQVGPGAAAAADGADHGTHVAGIALGNRSSGSPNKGVAPGARLIPINVFGPDETTTFSTLQRAFEYVEDLVFLNGGTNPHRIASINMSIGGGASSGICDLDPTMALLKPVIDSLRTKGVLATISAGNEYSISTMSFPACLSSMISVAATGRAASAPIASYSNISPATDLFAPGGEFGECVVSSVPVSTFGRKCGTSMAAPHVAGAIAVLRQKLPTASACKIEYALASTGTPVTDSRPGGSITKPRIRVGQALARLQSLSPPANDNMFSAETIPAFISRTSVTGYNFGASLQPGEPRHVVPTADRSVWWKWTPSHAGKVTIDTIGSGLDTVLAVYTQLWVYPGLMNPIAANDNLSATDTASRVSFSVAAGRTYYIAVAGKTAAQECGVVLNLQQPPPNDNFAQAISVPVSATATVVVEGSSFGATRERGEPKLLDSEKHTASVWYKFTAPATKSLTIDTEGSELADTILAVYRGDTLATLQLVAANDDGGVGLWSRVTFTMTAGLEYKVLVNGYNGASGPFQLRFRPATSPHSAQASGN